MVWLFLMQFWVVKPLDCPVRETVPVIDGSLADWPDEKWQVLSKQKVALATCRDGRYFYLAIRGEDPYLARKIRMGGLTVWLDPEGGRGKVLGVHLPGHMAQRPDREAGGLEAALRNPPPKDNSADALVVVGGDGAFRKKLEPGEGGGLEHRMTYTETGFYYELCVPLNRTEAAPYAVAVAGRKLGLGLETMQRPKRREVAARPDERGARPGASGGRGGMGRGGMGRGGGNGPGPGARGDRAVGGERKAVMKAALKQWFRINWAA